MAGDMASLHAGLIQRTRQPSEEDEWKRTEEKKAAQDSVRDYIQGKREEVPASLSWLSKSQPATTPQPAPQPVTPVRAPAPPTSSPSPAQQATPTAEPTPAPAMPKPAPPRPTEARQADTAAPAGETSVSIQTEVRPAELPSAMEVFQPVNKPRPFGKPKPRKKVVSGEKRSSQKRKALTLRLDVEEYERMIKAREATGRTAQDILETALSVYLNLLSIDDD